MGKANLPASMKENQAVEILREKVGRLIDDNRTLRTGIRKLAAEREKAVEQKRRAEERILELERRLRTLETAEAFTGQAGDTRVARQRISKLLRDIDRCIALLNQ